MIADGFFANGSFGLWAELKKNGERRDGSFIPSNKLRGFLTRFCKPEPLDRGRKLCYSFSIEKL